MKTKEELYSETFEVMTVNDREVLFTCLRINRDIVPEGLHAYDIRESDTGGEFATIELRVIVNHAGTILSKEVIEMGPDGFVEIDEYGFEDSMTLQEWLDSNTKLIGYGYSETDTRLQRAILCLRRTGGRESSQEGEEKGRVVISQLPQRGYKTYT